jgi:hypothetical protein
MADGGLRMLPTDANQIGHWKADSLFLFEIPETMNLKWTISPSRLVSSPNAQSVRPLPMIP